ncbi:uncharacterized protein LOC106644203 [Copidosoma floridanum]|uniref:uncharacterized protein LOC106644203 n=1 Tax=Copidosoma floridanum TaxID=29053 RepID=UPI0006C9B257|nr:uncharacterized protein LOC106644203 [Copidosoma floridanum]
MHGHKNILVIENLFTRWAEVVPLRQANGKALVSALRKHVIYCHGNPELLLIDNGTKFQKKDANLVERLNHMIKTLNRAFVEANHRSWDEKLPKHIFAYNTERHATTSVKMSINVFRRGSANSEGGSQGPRGIGYNLTTEGQFDLENRRL